MKEWLKQFFSSETGKPSRTGTIGVLLAVALAAAFLYVVISGSKVSMTAFSGGAPILAGLIASLLLGAKGADAYVAGKNILAKVPGLSSLVAPATPPAPAETKKKEPIKPTEGGEVK